MNRLVIIGNGFDLAHGLPTRYEDFIVWYLKRQIIESQNHQLFIVQDVLTKIKSFSELLFKNQSGFEGRFNSIEGLLEDEAIWWDAEFQTKMEFEYGDESPQEREWRLNRHKRPVRIKVHSEFFRKLLISKNWTDIESFYFKSLLQIYEESKKIESAMDEKLRLLNSEFEHLKTLLAEYISEIDKGPGRNVLFKTNSLNALHRCFEKVNSAVHLDKFRDLKLKNHLPERVIFVNFNYTGLLSEYVDKVRQGKDVRTLLYHIHGRVNMSREPIFGYGDESHESYLFLENQDNNEVLKHMKSFYYFADSTYSEIIDFVNSGPMDVYVIGHSLGLSDRVLLKTIFENENCRAIKLFHRGSDANQFEKRIALSRHFTDKIAMRSKILPYSMDDILN